MRAFTLHLLHREIKTAAYLTVAVNCLSIQRRDQSSCEENNSEE